MYRKIFYYLVVITTVFSFLFSAVSCKDTPEVPNLNSPVLSTPPADDEPPTEEDMPDEDDTSTEEKNPTDVEIEEDEETNDDLDNNEDVETPPLETSRRMETPEWIRGTWHNEISGQGMEDMTFTQYTFTYYGRDYTEGDNNTIFVFANDLLFEIDYTEDGVIKYIIFQKESDNRMTIITDNLDYSTNITYVKAVVED